MEEDGPVVLADLLALPDDLDGLHAHHVLHVEPHDAGVAAVVEHGERGVDGRADEVRLRALLLTTGKKFIKDWQKVLTKLIFSCLVLCDHLELRDLVRVELHGLEEVVQDSADQLLVLA